MIQNLDIDEIIHKYSHIETIWDKKDEWHYHVYEEIKKYIDKTIKEIDINFDALILNAGSAGEEYSLTSFQHIHLDIVRKNIEHTKNFVISNIENIPLENNSFDMIICVGSVLNYSDVLKSISEFSRLLKTNAYLILEFESSKGFEYLLTEHFAKSSTLVKTFYHGEEEKLWVYSEEYIKNTLDVYDLKFVNQNKFHILSGAVYRFTKNSNFSTKFSFFDQLLSHCKLINRFAANIILTYQKR